jgi:DNA (cytosine-5)-methyltransferase 1
VEAFTQNQVGEILTGDIMHSLGTNSNATGRNAANVVTVLNDQGGNSISVEKTEISPTLRSESHNHEPVVCTSVARRLTPVECERLQGFPDNWTNIPGAKDGPRYKAIGNSMAVPVMKWIGSRIEKVEQIYQTMNGASPLELNRKQNDENIYPSTQHLHP